MNELKDQLHELKGRGLPLKLLSVTLGHEPTLDEVISALSNEKPQSQALITDSFDLINAVEEIEHTIISESLALVRSGETTKLTPLFNILKTLKTIY